MALSYSLSFTKDSLQLLHKKEQTVRKLYICFIMLLFLATYCPWRPPLRSSRDNHSAQSIPKCVLLPVMSSKVEGPHWIHPCDCHLIMALLVCCSPYTPRLVLDFKNQPQIGYHQLSQSAWSPFPSQVLLQMTFKFTLTNPQILIISPVIHQKKLPSLSLSLSVVL